MTSATDQNLFLKVFSTLNEAQKRRFAGLRALEIGWGGISQVSNLTGLTYKTIRKGMDELKNKEKTEEERVRKPGGGRKSIEEINPKMIKDLEAIMDLNTAGDPMSLLKWTNKSTYSIADELKKLGHKVSPDTVGRLIKEMNYSLQANVKRLEGGTSPDRDQQFKYINKQVEKFLKTKCPVISVDTKKRENVGNFKNDGRTWEQKGQPKIVNVYDFTSLGIGVAIPYGIYDVNNNNGFVNVGVSYDTSEFAVESIRQWWNILGKYDYYDSNGLLICCDGGGSNGSRRKGWKYYLQKFADEIKIPITVSHLPPGTSKWNKIEHRMFSFISLNWKGKPLVNYETIINLIGSTRTKTGLTIIARLDDRKYEKGKKYTGMDMKHLNIQNHTLLPKWNYTLLPREIIDE